MNFLLFGSSKKQKLEDQTSSEKKYTKIEDPPPSEQNSVHTPSIEDPPPTTKDRLTDADPLHPGEPYSSDGKECGRTGVNSSEEDLVVPTVCQDEHQDQVVVTGGVHPVS